MGLDQNHLNWLISFLFDVNPADITQDQYILAHYYLDKLDVIDHYKLSSMVMDRLPERAKLLFLGEGYGGRQNMMREVIDIRGNYPSHK